MRSAEHWRTSRPTARSSRWTTRGAGATGRASCDRAAYALREQRYTRGCKKVFTEYTYWGSVPGSPTGGPKLQAAAEEVSELSSLGIVSPGQPGYSPRDEVGRYLSYEPQPGRGLWHPRGRPGEGFKRVCRRPSVSTRSLRTFLYTTTAHGIQVKG